MEKTHLTKSVLAFAALFSLNLWFVSCDKDNDTPLGYPESHLQEDQMICYYIDGNCHKVSISNDEELNLFLERMIALAKEGHSVWFSRTNNAHSSLSKEQVTYVTNNLDDAKKWAKKMLDDGYQVSISFNQQTGEYTCIAVK